MNPFMKWIRNRRLRRELADEVEAHLRERFDDLMESGMSEAEAMRIAKLEFGNATFYVEAGREAWGWMWVEGLFRDVALGARTLRKNPGFTGIAVLTLAVGIGANATIFSIVNGILLQPPPFRDPTRLVAVLDAKSSQGIDWVFDTPSRYEEWLRRNTVFEEIAAAQNCYYRMEEDGAPRLMQGGCASANFFPMLGVQPVLGRLFTAEDDRPGAGLVVLLSYRCWREHFGGSPSAIGKVIRRTANDGEATVIGVLPAGFQFATSDFTLWAPLRSDPNYSHREERNLLVFARLGHGVTLARAQSAMDSVARQLAEEFPAMGVDWSITVRPLQEFYSSVRNIRLTLWVLFAAVGVLLLIACANLASLLLTRASARRREIAVRLALGAKRGRVIRQLVTESLLLGLLGGVAGFLLARASFRPLMVIAPYIPSFRPEAVSMDTQVFLFAMAFAMAAAVAFGLGPAVRTARQDLNASLREIGRSALGSRRDRTLRSAVVALQIGLAVVLVAGAGLLSQSFRKLATEPLGFNPSHVLTAVLCCLDQEHYRSVIATSSLYRRLFERLHSVPGVVSVSGASSLPLRGFQGAGSPYEVRGRPSIEGREERAADFFFVEPHYFETLEIPLVRGRSLIDRDDTASAPVAVVNTALARRAWPGEDPVGKEIRITGDERWYRIVGVSKETRDRGLGLDPHPAIYVSYYQGLGRYTFLLIRTRPDPMSLAVEVRKAIATVNDKLPLDKLGALEEQMADSVKAQRFSVLLAQLFAVLALALGAVGVYGVTAGAVAQRTQEIGTRMALGASRSAVLGMFLRESIRLALIGSGAGLFATLWLTRFLQSLLYGMQANDPVVLTGAVMCLVMVAVVAAMAPAMRAMRVDPVRALRWE